MKMIKRAMFIGIMILVATVSVGLLSSGAAEKYPNKPINMILGYGLGGGTDTAARGIGPFLEKHLGVPIKIENRSGASGIIAMNYVYRQKPDGYTLLIEPIPAAIFANLTFPEQVKFDLLKFEPIFSWLNGDCSPLSVVADSPINSIKDLVEASKKKKLVAGGSGYGSLDFTVGALLREATGMDFNFVPYDGAAETLAALMGGHIDFALTSLTSSTGQASAGKIKILAVSLPERSSAAPDAPTFAEQGYPEITASFHIGAYGPPGMSRDKIEFLQAAFLRAYLEPGFQEWASKTGKPILRPFLAKEWGDFTKSEMKRYEKLIPLLEKYKPK